MKRPKITARKRESFVEGFMRAHLGASIAFGRTRDCDIGHKGNLEGDLL
jgi:hypothetical protein